MKVLALLGALGVLVVQKKEEKRFVVQECDASKDEG